MLRVGPKSTQVLRVAMSDALNIMPRVEDYVKPTLTEKYVNMNKIADLERLLYSQERGFKV